MRVLDLRPQPDGSIAWFDDEERWGITPAPDLAELHELPAIPDAPRLIVRSSAEIRDAASALAAWSASGWEAFERSVRGVQERIETEHPGARMMLWPGSGSVLSDGISTRTFARKHPSIGLVIDPAAWITPGMMVHAEDHLKRLAEACCDCGSLACVVVRSLGTGERVLDAEAVAGCLAPAIRAAGAVATVP